MYNIKCLDVKGYIYYGKKSNRQQQQHAHSFQLDFSMIRHLHQFDLNVDQIGSNHYNQIFFETTYIDSNNNEKAVYYRCEESEKRHRLCMVASVSLCGDPSSVAVQDDAPPLSTDAIKKSANQQHDQVLLFLSKLHQNIYSNKSKFSYSLKNNKKKLLYAINGE